jgi:mannan endo-1,4-beta-mannosidase
VDPDMSTSSLDGARYSLRIAVVLAAAAIAAIPPSMSGRNGTLAISGHNSTARGENRVDPGTPRSSATASPTTVETPAGTPSAAAQTATLPPGARTGQPPAVIPLSSTFVTRRGNRLYLSSLPYRFAGLNIYNANSRNVSTCWYTLNEGDGLSQTLDQLRGQNVFRADFYQGLALTNGQRDWSAFDKTLAVAAAHNMKVAASLSGEGGTCKDYPADTHKLEPWYQQGYTQPEASGVSYHDWVKEIVTRYKDNPTILLWQPMGEAEDPVDWGPTHTCSSTANQTLKSWADNVTGLIKSIDHNHLTTVGTIGSGQCGASGTAYINLYAGANIDLCEREDYGHAGAAMPGDQWNGMQARINQCDVMGKPLFVAETGIKPSEAGGTLPGRAAAFAAKLHEQFAAGIVGEFAWDWRDAPHGGSSLTGYEIGPGDPALSIFTGW